jgi:IS5 family transposase
MNEKQAAVRESHYVTVARLAYEMTQASLPLYAHPKSPHIFTLPQVASCVLLSFYLKLSYRDTEEWLLAADSVRAVLGLTRIPDYSTLDRTYHKLKLADWERMLAHLLAAANDGQGVEEAYVAVDSTYYAPTQASLYYLSRAGRTMRTPFKGGYAVGTESQLILAMRVGIGMGKDAHDLAPLRRVAKRCGVHTQSRRRRQIVLADAGYDGRSVIESDLVPPQRRNGIKDPTRLAKAEQVAQARLDGLYGQRWKAETVNSVIKRKFGSAIRSRSLLPQRREAAMRAVIYNLHVLLCLLQTILCAPSLSTPT